MSDSFADLWSASTPVSAKTTQTLGGGQSQSPRSTNNSGSGYTNGGGYDAFAMLSSRVGTPGSSRAGSAAGIHSTSASRPTLSSTSSGSGFSAQKPLSTSSTGSNTKDRRDAFGDLLAGTTIAPERKEMGRMTMAERAAAARNNTSAFNAPNTVVATGSGGGSGAWAGLDSLGGLGSGVQTKPVAVVEDVWGLGDFAAPVPAPAKSKPTSTLVDEDDWGLGDFGSPPTPATVEVPAGRGGGGRDVRGGVGLGVDDGWGSPPASKKKDLWDLDLDMQEVRTQSRNGASSGSGSRSRADTPSRDFDFGGREDADEGGLLGDDAEAEVDLFGEPQPRKRPTPPMRASGSGSQRPSTGSPPPHVLGRIVEMGFSVAQARAALAGAGGGAGDWDVEGAVEALLAGRFDTDEGGDGRDAPPMPRRPSDRGPPRRTQDAPSRAPPRRTQDGPSPPRRSPLSPEEEEGGVDKLLGQASAMGLSFFNKASAAIREGRERALKAYAERVEREANETRSRGAQEGGGRPRWMTEGAAASEDAADGEGVEVPVKERREGEGREVKQQEREREREAAPVVDLFAPEEPVAYVSPFRRGKPKSSAPSPSPSTQQPTPAPTLKSQPKSASQPGVSQPRSKSAPAPPARPPRVRAHFPPAVLKHKEAGAEAFRLGQYGEAEGAYGRALDTLGEVEAQEATVARAVLLNNRALVRLKTGDFPGVVGDVGVCARIFEGVWVQQTQTEGGAAGGEGLVDIGDALLKAWKRRAEAEEGRERWEDARKDWERVAGAGWAGGVRAEGVRGVGRCRRALGGAGASSGSTANGAAATGSRATAVGSAPPKPKPKPKPASRPAPHSAASEALRVANSAAEREDAERHALKDAVDARLLAWKKGKEGNVRALLGSLDLVLWDEVRAGVIGRGMAELVTEGGVKKVYLRAIGRVHPDKLNASNSTLEQRMIANGVFGALNEAWNAFRA